MTAASRGAPGSVSLKLSQRSDGELAQHSMPEWSMPTELHLFGHSGLPSPVVTKHGVGVPAKHSSVREMESAALSSGHTCLCGDFFDCCVAQRWEQLHRTAQGPCLPNGCSLHFCYSVCRRPACWLCNMGAYADVSGGLIRMCWSLVAGTKVVPPPASTSHLMDGVTQATAFFLASRSLRAPLRESLSRPPSSAGSGSPAIQVPAWWPERHLNEVREAPKGLESRVLPARATCPRSSSGPPPSAPGSSASTGTARSL